MRVGAGLLGLLTGGGGGAEFPALANGKLSLAKGWDPARRPWGGLRGAQLIHLLSFQEVLVFPRASCSPPTGEPKGRPAWGVRSGGGNSLAWPHSVGS